ncbi:hypothetical protein OJF2_19460 [Aquisphaera giovannonii]|uniref:Uncharacterized protein n=1 Tax=Aquisphaera giovannonii TaxID=406548 RepID=A0A5B9VZR9_9BACT|nr:hypothetical protein [Aquisphaera giovannonii]QEH33444.1 hypothetical protein OJF2_19460 [Aquisphaera giovannonii]
MTFEQCQAVLSEIRQHQGTDHPLVQVTCSGAILRGRVLRSDSDRPARPNQDSPFGLLVLQQPGLFPGPLNFIQIASIPSGGLLGLLADDHADASSRHELLVGAAS